MTTSRNHLSLCNLIEFFRWITISIYVGLHIIGGRYSAAGVPTNGLHSSSKYEPVHEA